MKVGDIYDFTGNRIRIMMLDDREVFYQTVKENDSFIYAKNKTLSYYRTPKEFFEQNSIFISPLAFSEKEVETHRPDLPLRLNCFSGLFWTDQTCEKDILQLLSKANIKSEILEGLKTSAVVIFPTTQKLTIKKPTLLQNDKGYFTGKELLMECFNIQKKYVKTDKPYFSRFRLISEGREEKRLSGIGIYRLGIKGNVPSFYIGGEISMMELESESRFIVEK